MVVELARKIIKPLVLSADVSAEQRGNALAVPTSNTKAGALARRFKSTAVDVRVALTPFLADGRVQVDDGHYSVEFDKDLAPEEVLDHVPAILKGWPKAQVKIITAALLDGGVGSGEE